MSYGREKSETIDHCRDDDLQQADELHRSPEKVRQEGQAPWWMTPVVQDLTWETTVIKIWLTAQHKEWARELVLYTWIIIVVRVETRSGNKPTNYFNTNTKPYSYIDLFIPFYKTNEKDNLKKVHNITNRTSSTIDGQIKSNE